MKDNNYSTDNECLLTGALWSLLAAIGIGLLSWIFFSFWPTVVVIFVIALLIGLIIVFFMCKNRTVGRGGVDARAVDLARSEMSSAAPAAAATEAGAPAKAGADAAAAKLKAEADAANAKAEADAKAAKADADAKVKAKAKADAAKSKAKADADAKAAKAKAASKAKAAKTKAEAKAAEDDHEHEGEVGAGEAKPALLTEARGGKADDLKQIKGIGPKLEKELNGAGVFHFDQIASWTKEEVYWADNHLVSFKGRVSRDNWVGQAKEFAK